MSSTPLVVEALFTFKGKNNDELCFKKGDKITITQKDDEGWWEGTLGDKTGWFPSNYVKECKETIVLPMSPATQRQNRAVVLKDLIDSEKAHVSELQTLVKNFLKPLEKSTILTSDEYKQLTGNINEVVDTHQQLLNLVEDCETKPSDEQRVGKLFLTWAPRIKAVHQAYCSMHPKAVCILDLHKDELATYMESCGAATPGLLVLTTGLSKPFRRLEKYSQMLQELERHVEVNHADRGDIQRSVAVYKDIASTCLATRRQKELELQVLTGPVRGWEGQSLAQLGDIIHMGLVTVEPQHQDRYLVLFPNTLLMLSVSHRMSAFIYEGKLPLTNISVNRLEDSPEHKNVFEISGPLIERIVAVCQTREETIHWVELLRQHTNKGHMRSPPPPSIDGHRPNPHLDHRGYSTLSSILNYFYTPILSYTPILPPAHYAPASPYCTLTKSFYRLVKEKIITHRLLKNLLYSEHLKFVDTTSVKRRQHKTEIYIKTSASNSDSDDYSEEENSNSNSNSENENRNCLLRQNAVYDSDRETSDISETSSFGFIRYFNADEGPTESFIDHGEHLEVKNLEAKKEDSPKKLTLAVTNQISGESGSSFEITTKPYMACEDLVNIDETVEINLLNTNKYIPKERHSLPSKFVGNKFNKSSMTMVYIPHWSNSTSCLQKSTSRSSESDESDTCTDTTHSSSIDLPVNPIPVPDAMVAEILYNFDQDDGTNVLKPPTMFRSDSYEPIDRIEQNKKSITHSLSSLSLQYANVNFRKHSFNSDKPKRISKTIESLGVEPYENLGSATEEVKAALQLGYDASKHCLSKKKPAQLNKTTSIDTEFQIKKRSEVSLHISEPTSSGTVLPTVLPQSVLDDDDDEFKPRVIYLHRKDFDSENLDFSESEVSKILIRKSGQLPTLAREELELFQKLTTHQNQNQSRVIPSPPGLPKQNIPQGVPLLNIPPGLPTSAYSATKVKSPTLSHSSSQDDEIFIMLPHHDLEFDSEVPTEKEEISPKEASVLPNETYRKNLALFDFYLKDTEDTATGLVKNRNVTRPKESSELKKTGLPIGFDKISVIPPYNPKMGWDLKENSEMPNIEKEPPGLAKHIYSFKPAVPTQEKSNGSPKESQIGLPNDNVSKTRVQNLSERVLSVKNLPLERSSELPNFIKRESPTEKMIQTQNFGFVDPRVPHLGSKPNKIGCTELSNLKYQLTSETLPNLTKGESPSDKMEANKNFFYMGPNSESKPKEELSNLKCQLSTSENLSHQNLSENSLQEKEDSKVSTGLPNVSKQNLHSSHEELCPVLSKRDKTGLPINLAKDLEEQSFKVSSGLPNVTKRRSSHEESSPVLPKRDFDLLRRRSSHEEQFQNFVNQNRRGKVNSLRKCVSYHYLQIGRRPSCNYSPFCRCCTEPCFSRRSSDSGMAGSCTLNSPDIGNNEIRFSERDNYSLRDVPINLGELGGKNSYFEMEAKDFENQCRCTSPFGSTPRTSCQASTSDNILVETHEFSNTSTTSSSCSNMSPFPIPEPWESENQIHEKIMKVKNDQHNLNLNNKISASSSSASKSKSCDNILDNQFEQQNETETVYRSGLYAHWWLKAKLPISVVKGIIEEKNSNTADVTSEPDSDKQSPHRSPPKPS